MEVPFNEAVNLQLKLEKNKSEFNNQLTSFGKLLKRKESILFFNQIYE